MFVAGPSDICRRVVAFLWRRGRKNWAAIGLLARVSFVEMSSVSGASVVALEVSMRRLCGVYVFWGSHGGEGVLCVQKRLYVDCACVGNRGVLCVVGEGGGDGVLRACGNDGGHRRLRGGCACEGEGVLCDRREGGGDGVERMCVNTGEGSLCVKREGGGDGVARRCVNTGDTCGRCV